MAITLVGTVVNNCDAITGFNAGNISTDDPFVQGTACVGLKATGSTANELYTTTITGGPYNFSSGGGQFTQHILVWLNSKSPLTAAQGFQIVVGNGTSRGRWYVPPANYTGGFVPRVVDSARAFDIIAAGTWTTGGNPGQLSSVTQVGGAVNPTVSIMGSFNNIGIDQITIGVGARADAGTSGTPNTWETVRAADQDTAIWGWFRKELGAIAARGKLLIGPATGATTSYFVDSDFLVIFAKELVAVSFYEINTRGGGTTCSFTRGTILAEDPTTARWLLTIQSDTLAFSDTDGIWEGAGAITLQSVATLTRTKMVNCGSLTQNGATLTGCTVLSAPTTSGNAFILGANPGLISSCSFTHSNGHAMEVDARGTYTFAGNKFTSYGSNGTNEAAIYNNITPTTAGSYSETNQDTTTSLRSGSTQGVGQSFANSASGVLSACRFYLKKTGSPTGNAVAKIYAHSGTLGTSSVPTGAALATSDNFDVSTLTTSYALAEFKFTGSNNVTLSASTNYVVTIEYSGGSSGNTLDVGSDASSPSASGNLSTYNGSSWTAVAGQDACFYVYTGGDLTLNVTSNGDTPTYRNAIGCSTTVNNAVTLTIKVVDALGAAISGARVAIYKSGDVVAGHEIVNTTTNGSGIVSSSYAYTADQAIVLRIRDSTTGTDPRYINNDSSGTITSTGFSATITMIADSIAAP